MSPSTASHLPQRPTAALETVTIGGQRSSVVTLDNRGGVRVRLLGYGATVMAIEAPDRVGRAAGVVLGFEDPARYLGEHPYFGSTVGRFANRIRNARFTLDGREVLLDANENGHQLHGGGAGFHRAWFDAELLHGVDYAGVSFSRSSPDGEGGYPGNLSVRVDYRLHDSGALRIDFHAETDQTTVVNLTHHGYFNLSGGERDIREHLLWIAADRYVPLDADGIPTGGTLTVDDTAFDFREPTRIGVRLGAPELASRKGYDHPFLVRSKRGDLRHVARLRDLDSGRRLDVHTTEPVLHLYTGQLLDPQSTGHRPFGALCLETGQAPDTPNQPDLGSCRLAPGESYQHSVVYTFAVD